MCFNNRIAFYFVVIEFVFSNALLLAPLVDNSSSFIDGGIGENSIAGGGGQHSLGGAEFPRPSVGFLIGGVGAVLSITMDGVVSGVLPNSFVDGVEVNDQETSTDLEIDEMKSLYQEMFTSYNALIRPRLDLNDPVTILTRFVPHTIVHFNTQAQVFSLFGYFVFEWRDEVLANASDFNGTLRVTRDQVWVPPVRIAKSVGPSHYVGDKVSDIIGIQSNGSMQWVPEGTFSFVCEVNVEFYPFDIQICVLTFYVEGETSTTVDLRYVGSVDLSEYVRNAEWNLIYSRQYTRNENSMTYIDLHFKVERRGTFETMTVLAPPISMSLISGFPFLIPISYGEKGTISIMIFFGYTIFMTVIVNSLPHNSLHVSYLVIYTIYLLSGSIFLVLYSILQHKIYSVIRFGNWRAVFRIAKRLCYDKEKKEGKELCLNFFPKLDICVFIAISVFNTIGTTTLLSLLHSHSED